MRSTEHDRALVIAERWLEHLPDMTGDPDCDECQVARQLIRATERADTLRSALEESVKLQSHYAELLNEYDGGERLRFASADTWVMRLLGLPGWRDKLYQDGKTPDAKAINDAAAEHRRKTINPVE